MYRAELVSDCRRECVDRRAGDEDKPDRSCKLWRPEATVGFHAQILLFKKMQPAAKRSTCLQLCEQMRI
jgi:hypothetical protein